MARKVEPGARGPSGWLVIDKPAGMTSAGVVNRVKRLMNMGRRDKAGHAGTLDPLATGILAVALGEATKVVSHIMDDAKTYTFRVKWGEARDTDDADGKVTGHSEVLPEAGQIEALLPQFVGVISQIPPDYSAIKVDGKRAYALARANETLVLSPRNITVHRFELVESGPDWATFEVNCGKGTYIRALVRDMARELVTLGHVTVLRRTASGPFDESMANSLDKLESLGHSAALLEQVLPVQAALADIPALELTENEANCLRHGQTVATPYTGNGLVCAMQGSRLVAMAEADGVQIRPRRVFNF